MKKQVLSLALSVTMLASMLPKPAFAADNTITFPDMPSDWSTQALQNAINNGLLNGIDGKIAAGENLTRAQMAAIVTRAFGTNGKANISSFGDVNAGDWFYDAMASSVLMGAFQGDGVNLNPNANITRQEAFTVLARLFTLSGGDQSVLSSYTDGAQVADWAKDSMASMVAAGYVKGSDNMLNPRSSITRAEFAQVMDNLVKTYFADSRLNVNANGNAVLNKAGTLEGATISGDLIIGDGAAEGDVVLKDVTVSGRLLVRGGGTSTVTLGGNTTVGSIAVNKPTGAVRVKNNTQKSVNVNALSDNVVLTGDFNEVNANASQGTVTLTGADVATMNVAGTSAKVVVSEKSTVETMNVQGSASGAAVSVQSGTNVKTMNTAASKAVVTVNGTVNTMSVAGSDTTVKAEEGAKVEKITTSAAKTTVSGKGSVANFEAAKGSSGADITTDGTKVVNNGTGNVTTGNDKVIGSGSTGASKSDSTGTTTPGGSTGGGSTGGGSTVTTEPVSGIVGVRPVDQRTEEEGKIPDGDMPTVTASAVKDLASGIVTIKLSTDKEVPLHQNAEKTEGYWVGVAVEVPKEIESVNYYFGTTASKTTDASTPPETDPTIGDKQYFVAFVNAGAVAPKTHLTLQWGKNEAVQYVIDLSGVKVGIEGANEGAKKALAQAEAKLTSGVTVKGKADAEKVQNAVKKQIGEIAKYTVEATEASGSGSSWTVTVTVTGTGDDKASKAITLAVTEDTEETVSTVDELKAALTNKDVLTVTVASDLGKLSENLEVPSGKALVIAEGGTLTVGEGVTLTVDKGATFTQNGTVKGTNVVLTGGTPNFSKLVKDGTTKVWVDDASKWVEYTQQQAALRDGNGPGKPGTDSFDYGAAYTEAGVTWNKDGTGFTVDQATVNKFIQAYAAGKDDATDKAFQLTQPSGELSADGLFVGVKFAAPSGVDTKTGSVYVYRDGNKLGKNDAYQLTPDSVDGTGGDVFANNFTNYLVFAKAEKDKGLSNKTWNYIFVWQNEGKVVGVSHCTITRTVTPDTSVGA